MTAIKISDLLPIPDGARKPHAYQVFGLEGGEQDADKIKAAVQNVYLKLKDSQADTDPKLWKKAAAVVEKARSILSDPRKRAALDERFGVIRFDEEPNAAVSHSYDPLAGVLPSNDPLASVLPSSDPLGAVVPGGNPMAVASPTAVPGTAPMGTASMGTASMGTAPMGSAPMGTAPMGVATPQATAPAQTAPPRAPAAVTKPSPVFVPKKSSRRRRKSSLAIVMFTTFMLAMFSIIGSALYFMFSGGQLSFTQKDGKVSISTSPSEPIKKQISNPGPIKSGPPVPLDPVMGIAPRGSSRPADSLASADPTKNSGANAATGMTSPPGTMVTPPTQPAPEPAPQPEPEPTPAEPEPAEPPMAKPPETTETPEPTPPTTPNSETLPVKPGAESPATEMTDEMIAQADAAIKNVEMLIKQADWEKMKPAAEKVTEMTLTDQQRDYADALYNLADLATFYRGGIVRGMASLQTASTFEIAEGVSVLVVETSDNEITIRRSARNQTFTLDQMPFVLADRLAAFVLPPDKPDSMAARSCYQCIAPKSTDEYRKEALSWLQFVNDDLEDVDTKKIADAVKKLFPDA